MKGLVSFILLCCFTMLSCKREQPHLSHQQMAAVLLDAHLAESYSAIAGRDSAKDFISRDKDSLQVYYHAIFAHHRITADQFIRSMDWYRDHPDELDTIYTRTMQLLDKSGGSATMAPHR